MSHSVGCLIPPDSGATRTVPVVPVLGLCLSFILLTSAEMIGGSVGMGYYVKYYSDFSDYTRILAGIIVIGVVITLISTLFAAFQHWMLRWR